MEVAEGAPSSAHPSGRILHLDGWRGVAIAAVLLGHFAALGAPGPFGVEVFFVLSGRLMAEILIVRRFPLPSFFVRRFSRIYPAMLVLAVTLLAAGIVARSRGLVSPLPSVIDVIAACTFTINYLVVLHGSNSALTHLWSICVEEHCYAALALIALVTRRTPRATGIIVAVIAVIAMINGWVQYDAGYGSSVYWRSDVRLASVFSSFALYLWLNGRIAASSWAAAILFAAAAGLFAATDYLPLCFTAGTLALALSVNLLDSAAPRLKRLLSWRPLVYLGVISYSLYLWQQPFYRAAGHLPTVPLLLLAVVVAIASFYLIETPARVALNRWWRRRAERGSRMVAAPE